MQGSDSSISPAIIESLYTEALHLAEQARLAFEAAAPGPAGAAARLALSGEALRTTTRMMHALAWLLNHRAFHAGELSARQLERHSRLPAAQPVADQAQLAPGDPRVEFVAHRSHDFYQRLLRLDAAWRAGRGQQDHPLRELHAKIGRSLAAR
jgi:regulator of CtrA degradation